MENTDGKLFTKIAYSIKPFGHLLDSQISKCVENKRITEPNSSSISVSSNDIEITQQRKWVI